jgi:hypothetical protein
MHPWVSDLEPFDEGVVPSVDHILSSSQSSKINTHRKIDVNE